MNSIKKKEKEKEKDYNSGVKIKVIRVGIEKAVSSIRSSLRWRSIWTNGKTCRCRERRSKDTSGSVVHLVESPNAAPSRVWLNCDRSRDSSTAPDYFFLVAGNSFCLRVSRLITGTSNFRDEFPLSCSLVNARSFLTIDNRDVGRETREM